VASFRFGFHVIAAVIMAVGLAGCGDGREDGSTTAVAVSSSVPSATPPVQVQVRWKMTSTFNSSLNLLGTMGKRVEDEINRISGGSFQIQFHNPGILAPAFETFDAVSYGALEAGWSTSGYWAGKVPALQLFTSMPFGPTAEEYLGWYYEGGGRALYETLYNRHNIHPLVCGISPPEAAGWFREPIHSAEDFKGLKIRFFGLGAKVLEKLGASPQLIAGGEIFQALELGTIDATEYSMPSVDYNLGFYEVAKNYYFPGWHQQSSLFELIVHKKAWDALGPMHQAQLESVCDANVRYGLSEGAARQAEYLEKITAKGVTIRSFDAETLDALKAAWLEVAAEMSASDPDFAEVWSSLQAFRSRYQSWSNTGYLRR